MAKALPFRKRRKNGYAHTVIHRQCGSKIHCRKCGYTGCADVLDGNVFCGERCSLCRSLNFYCVEVETPPVLKNLSVVQLSFLEV